MRRILLASLLLLSIVACKKSGGDDDMTGPDAPGTPGGTTYSLQWGPVTVPADTEDTQCVILNLGNTAEIKVHEIDDTLSPGSHHMIVYKDDLDTTEQPTPKDCQPFVGALNTTGGIEPLAITQITSMTDDIVLPTGVAYTFAPNQMIKFELHYINTTDNAVPVMGNVTFVAADPSTIQNEAGLIFAGSPDVDVKANAQTTLHEFFTVPSYLDLSSTHIFAITGHEHHLGVGVEVNVAPSSTGPFTPVYNPTNFLWSEPPTQQQNPDFAVPVGGGFDFTCEWNNGTGQEVTFGESACDEMCFFWAYYWPSQGSKVCVHTDQVGSGYDACCPGDIACGELAGVLGSGQGSAGPPTCMQ